MANGRQRAGMVRRRLSPEEDHAVAEEFRGGLTAAEIARVRGVPHYIIANSLRRSGLRAADRWANTLKEPKIISPGLFTEIREFYRRASLEATAEKFGLSLRRVRALVGGTRRRGERLPLPDATIADIVQRWRDGETKASIAAAYGMNKMTISKLLRRCVDDFEGVAAGRRHWKWKGGRRLTRLGYVVMPIDRSHPFFDEMHFRTGTGPNCTYVFEHRLVMAEHLGRPLLASETVHHVNGIRDENRIENLQLRISVHGAGIVLRCRACGSSDVVADPIADGPRSLAKP